MQAEAPYPYASPYRLHGAIFLRIGQSSQLGCEQVQVQCSLFATTSHHSVQLTWVQRKHHEVVGWWRPVEVGRKVNAQKHRQRGSFGLGKFYDTGECSQLVAPGTRARMDCLQEQGQFKSWGG